MIYSTDLLVRISNLTHALSEASAKGFLNNPDATRMTTELKHLTEQLEEQAHAECMGRKV